MKRALLSSISALALAACIPTLTGAPCGVPEDCPGDQTCVAQKCVIGPRTGGGGGSETGGGSATGGGSGGGGATGGGSETGGGTATGGGSATGGGAATGGGSAPDTTAPLVIATTPTNASTSVSVNTSLDITFSEPMNTATVVYVTTNNVTYGAPTWNGDNTRITLKPTAALPFNTMLTVTVGGQDVAGNGISPAYSYTFTTEATPDTTQPTLIETQPTDGGVGVPVSTELLFTFSEPMNPASVMVAIPSVVFGTPTWADNNTQLSIAPNAPLQPSTSYQVTVTGSDVAGNMLSAGTGFSFTTAAPPDTTAPTLVSSDPTSNEMNVPVTRRLSLTFSEPMNTSALQVTVDPDPGLGAPTWSLGDTKVTFAQTDDWDFSTSETVTLSGLDLAGNALSTTFKFTTEAPPDTTAPTVTSTSPDLGATGVPTQTAIEFNFSEPMNTASTQAAFTSTPAIACNFTWNAARTLMVCSHGTPLNAGASYTVTLGNGAVDDAGLSIATPYVLTFVTASAPDVTNPTVVSTSPTKGAVGAPRARFAGIRGYPAQISVTFSERMSQASVQGAFSIVSPTGFNGGTFSWSGNTMTYTPPDFFDWGQVVQVRINTGATDLAGNPLTDAPVTFSYRIRRRDTVTVTNNAANAALDGYIYGTSNCSSATVATGSSVTYAGDRYFSATPTLNVYRGYLTFSLASITQYANVDVDSAFLYLDKLYCNGSPFTATFGGSINAYHVNYGPALDLADCNLSPLNGRQYTVTNSLAYPSVHSANVSSAVADDVTNFAARGSRSQFQLRTPNAVSDNDTVGDYCYFGSYNNPTSTNRPYLSVTFTYD